MRTKRTVQNQTTLQKATARIKASGSRLARVRAKIKGLGLTEEDAEKAMRWVRHRSP